MKEVIKDEFYKEIGPQDACVSVENTHKFPYTSLFKLRYGRLLGKAVDSYTDGIKNKYPIITKYYLST